MLEVDRLLRAELHVDDRDEFALDFDRHVAEGDRLFRIVALGNGLRVRPDRVACGAGAPQAAQNRAPGTSGVWQLGQFTVNLQRQGDGVRYRSALVVFRACPDRAPARCCGARERRAGRSSEEPPMRFKIVSACLLVVAFCVSSVTTPKAATERAATLPSFAEPGVSPDHSEIAFVSGGDVWSVPSSGGTARLLASAGGYARRPLFSPDGKRLAFASSLPGRPVSTS